MDGINIGINIENGEWERFNLILDDGGPLYMETAMHKFIVEPWNAISSLLLMVPAIYWAIRLKGKYRKHYFLALCIPLLIIGGLGSALFHGFRASQFLLMMDVFPILILNIAVSLYAWFHLLKKWWKALLMVIPLFYLQFLVFQIFPTHTANNLAYLFRGINIFLPLSLLLIKTRFRYFRIILFSLIFLALALFFREIDAREIHGLPMGTHFLWHTFSAIGAFFMANYLYVLKEKILPSLSAAITPVQQ
jgi:hypothetical protein